MKSISLIKKIEYHPNMTDVYPVTFEIGCDFDRERIKKIYNVIKDKNLLATDDLSLGESSFTVHVALEEIPGITTILVENDLAFYGIYVLYDKFLEMKETKEVN